MAQTAVAMLPAAATITAVDWKVVVGTAALAGVSSLLTSLAGMPEENKTSKGRASALLLSTERRNYGKSNF